MLVGGGLVKKDEGDRSGVALATQHLRRGVASGASTQYDHRLWYGTVRGASGRGWRWHSSLQLAGHEDRLVAPVDRPARNRIERRCTNRFAGAQAKARVVPGTTHRFSDVFFFEQKTAYEL